MFYITEFKMSRPIQKIITDMWECTVNTLREDSSHEGGRGGTARNKFQDTPKDNIMHILHTCSTENYGYMRMSRKSPDFTQELVDGYLQMAERVIIEAPQYASIQVKTE